MAEECVCIITTYSSLGYPDPILNGGGSPRLLWRTLQCIVGERVRAVRVLWIFRTYYSMCSA